MAQGRETQTQRTLAVAAVLLALAALGFALAPAAAESKTRYRVTGAGFGHGVGLSQWGAYGYAQKGRRYKRIATHYFKKTKIGKTRSRQIRVLLGTRSGNVSFSRSKRACGRKLKPSRTYRAQRKGGKVRLERNNGKRITGCGKRLTAKGGGPLKIGGKGVYRGDLVATASGGSLYVVNKVGLDPYLRGVVPNEMPASWPIEALKAQALAARSYALATEAGGPIFDAYDDTRSQVYGGLSSESRRTSRAVRKSRREVIKYRGKPIPAYFSSSSGGRTENVEFGFPGAAPKPYLKSVRDPFDRASPDHRWRETFSRSRMQELLGSLVKGRLKGIRVTKRGVSPRIVTAKVLGSRGRTRVTGSDLRFRLGLRSTWAKFKKLK